MDLEFDDIQGLLVSSYKHQPYAAYVMLRIKDPVAARRWLAAREGKFTNATGKSQGLSINIALTIAGLTEYGLTPGALKTFSAAFQDGMNTPRRSRILGDDGDNDPVRWTWGGSRDTAVDVLLLFFAEEEVRLDEALRDHESALQAGGPFEKVAVLRALRPAGGNAEHFGFNDGIGQPVMEGTGNKTRQMARTNHATELPPGEFMLGHPNIYGVISPSPVIAAADDPQNILHTLENGTTALDAKSGMRDFGRNGSYLVFRQLAQDVAAFSNFLEEASRRPDGTADPSAREWLAAKLVGRWRNGTPLVLSKRGEDPNLSEENNFNYRDDLGGLRCPVGAHIRRANPRDSLGPDPETALISANRHRLIRRARSYGPRLADPLHDDGLERGLHFICLNGDLERQFEFVQQTWINNPVFGGLYNEVDPLVGNLESAQPLFTIQAEPLRKRISNLSRFVTVKGGAYFFLPSLRALHYLTTLQ